MTTPNKAKGSQFERDCVQYFNEHGFPNVERRYGAGAQSDKGDLQGFAKRLVIECKNVARVTLSTILDETEAEKANAGVDIGIAVIKRRGKGASRAYAVLSLEDVTKLLKDAGY